MTSPSQDDPARTNSAHALPTLVFVQGSFQLPDVYQNLVDRLTGLGYTVVYPRLPSCTDTSHPQFPHVSLYDDAIAVRSELIRQVEYEGKAVVLVMHSYGGLVGSEAMRQELNYTQRKLQGLPGGVIHLFLYAAFLLDEGQSVLSAFGESPNNDIKPDGRFCILNGETTLYNDLSPTEASMWASKLIVQSYKVQTTELTHAAWKYIPSTYLICDNDQAAPQQYQEMFAAQAKSQVVHCSSGHSPHLSQPEMLVQKIHEVSQEANARIVEGIKG